MLTFHDTGKKFEMKGDLLKMITNKNYNLDLAGLSDKKLKNDFAKQMNFDVKGLGGISTRDGTLIKLLKSPGLMVFASGVSKTIFSSSDLDELWDVIRILMQEKQGAINSELINEEFIAIVDKLLQYQCISKKQHKQLLNNGNLLHKQIWMYVYMFFYYVNV